MTGHYEFNMDQKGRISIPAKLRSELGSKIFVSNGLGNCLKVYPESEWQKLMDKIGEQSYVAQEEFRRFFCANSQEVSLDKQGRFCLSGELRQYAGITDIATIVGVGNVAEIWSKERWDEVNGKMSEEKIRALMEQINF